MKTLKLQKVFVLICWLCIGSFSLFTEVDYFYTKIYNEGKDVFMAGKYQEAIENFKIAEFGLLDEPETVKEVYLYYALAYIQLNRLEEAGKIVKRYSTELDIKDLDTIPVPGPIKNPGKAMLAAFSRAAAPGEHLTWGKIYQFELRFLEALDNLEAGKFEIVKDYIRRLGQIDKKAQRIYYIKGLLEFQNRQYKDCVKELNKIVRSLFAPSLLDSLYYHLSLSYHYLQNREQVVANYNKIKNLKIKTRAYNELTGKNKNPEQNKKK
ncbi:MAG: hypothetical protein KAW12_29010 [Candidatus Aminicenantes bacterium]|nr:hypothetical protein [Candidatus Aminicenantes bacterium]